MRINPSLIVIPATLFVLSGCTARDVPRPQNWARAVQTADTREAHELLAKHYEEVARTMQADTDEEREMLIQYQANPHKYGKRILDLKARAEAMIRDFEMAAQESRKMAEYHRQLATENP